MTFEVVTTPEADEQISTIDAWWRRNRTVAPNLFAEELASSFELLGSIPDVGRAYRHARVRNVRRVLLRSTRYHVYYTIERDTVIVLAVWSAVRGSDPELALPTLPNSD